MEQNKRPGDSVCLLVWFQIFKGVTMVILVTIEPSKMNMVHGTRR